jgi:hypothetical protein
MQPRKVDPATKLARWFIGGLIAAAVIITIATGGK